jgi:transposase
LLRKGVRRPEGFGAWSARHRLWLQRLVKAEDIFTNSPALAATFSDYLGETDRLDARLLQLEQIIRNEVATAPTRTQTLVRELQTMRGVAFLTAVTLVAELGSLSRFLKPTQLMSYAGLTASE